MFTILEKEIIAQSIKSFKISAPEIAAKALPGQFIILRIDENGERVPMTIADSDSKAGTITLIFQEVGRSTYDMGTLEAGNHILDLVGPLGKPSEIENYGHAVCIGGGVGIAPLYPITRALKQAGNQITSIIGARSENHMILQQEMQEVSDSLLIASDDGSIGEKGFVTDILTRILENGSPQPSFIIAIGPLVMMKAVANLTRPYGIKTTVSLNPIMVDGTGMCGACRVLIGDKTLFACVDGPEFDAHQVDWLNAEMRSRMFNEEEKIAMQHKCSGGDCQCLNQKR